MMPRPALRTALVGEIELAYLQLGEGPLVILLHGFPDNARTWSHQVSPLVEAGFTVVSPYLRGYPPSTIPHDGDLSMRSVASAIAELVSALGSRQAAMVGHDWGGRVVYSLLEDHQQLVARACIVGTTHPACTPDVINQPALLHYSFHWWLFQVEGLAEMALGANDFALVDYLWSHWSYQPVDKNHVETVKRETLRLPGAAAATLAYYRSQLRATSNPMSNALTAIVAPTLAIFGERDPALLLAAGEERFFMGTYRRETLAEASHFPHREQPALFNRLLLEWLEPWRVQTLGSS